MSSSSKVSSRSRSRSRHSTPSFIPEIRSSSPHHGHPITTYHTNTLNLFQETGEPIFHATAPTLTNMVPPEPLDHEHVPVSFGPSRPQIMDYEREGGWDGDGTRYEPHGGIEEVLDESITLIKPLASQLTGPSGIQSPIPLPPHVPPPPRPRVRPFEIGPESPGILKMRLGFVLSDDKHPIGNGSPRYPSSALSQSWTPSHLRNLSAAPTGTLSPLNVFEPSHVSTPVHHPFAIPPSFTPGDIFDDDEDDEDDEDEDDVGMSVGLGMDLDLNPLEIPNIPSITTSPGPSRPQPTLDTIPNLTPVIRPIRISRSPTPPIPSIPPTPPPKDTKDTPRALHDDYDYGSRSSSSHSHSYQVGRDSLSQSQRDSLTSSNRNPKKRRRSLTPGKAAHSPPPPPKKKNIDTDLDVDKTTPASAGNLKKQQEQQQKQQKHHHPNDERIIEEHLSSIGNLSSVVRSISKGIIISTSSKTPKTTAGANLKLKTHTEMCERVIDSLSQVEKALIRRREVPIEHWEDFPFTSRCRYERRLKSLERSLARLRTMSEYILGLVGSVGLFGKIRLLEVVVDKLARHHAKLQDVALKLNATFDRLKLRHLHKIASTHVAQANVCRTAYLEARQTYFVKRTRGGFREL